MVVGEHPARLFPCRSFYVWDNCLRASSRHRDRVVASARGLVGVSLRPRIMRVRFRGTPERRQCQGPPCGSRSFVPHRSSDQFRPHGIGTCFRFPDFIGPSDRDLESVIGNPPSFSSRACHDVELLSLPVVRLGYVHSASPSLLLCCVQTTCFQEFDLNSLPFRRHHLLA